MANELLTAIPEQNKFLELYKGTGFRFLKRTIAALFLASTFSQLPQEANAQSAENIVSNEILRLAPIAKIILYTELGGGSFEMGHAGIGRETITVNGVPVEVAQLCTISHIPFPYEQRDLLVDTNPTPEEAAAFFENSRVAVRTAMLSGVINPQDTNYLIHAGRFEERTETENELPSQPFNDPVVCSELSPDATTRTLERAGLDFEDIPLIADRVLPIKSVVFAFDRNSEPHFYTVTETDEEGFNVAAQTQEGEVALDRGDSGTPFYQENEAGEIEMVGIYRGRMVVPTRSGGELLFQGTTIR